MFYFGADYYPEHWPEERWAEDARLKSTRFRLAEKLTRPAWYSPYTAARRSMPPCWTWATASVWW